MKIDQKFRKELWQFVQGQKAAEGEARTRNPWITNPVL